MRTQNKRLHPLLKLKAGPPKLQSAHFTKIGTKHLLGHLGGRRIRAADQDLPSAVAVDRDRGKAYPRIAQVFRDPPLQRLVKAVFPVVLLQSIVDDAGRRLVIHGKDLGAVVAQHLPRQGRAIAVDGGKDLLGRGASAAKALGDLVK